MLQQTINKKTDLLIVGNYTHDTIIDGKQKSFQRLGGGAAYACAVAVGLDQNFEVISKVGSDFHYLQQCLRFPRIAPHTKTTSFVNYTSEIPRRHHVNACCEPIYPHDIHQTATTSIVCGVMGEILPKTIQTLRKTSTILIGDIQGFIRQLDKSGEVHHTPLEATDYHEVIHLFDFLKVSDEELPFINIEKLRQNTTLLITYGDDGCSVYERDTHTHVPTRPLFNVDSTGAGDSFLAGFASGLCQNLSVEEAIQLGHYCGGVAVQSVGIPATHSFRQLADNQSQTVRNQHSAKNNAPKNKGRHLFPLTTTFPLQTDPQSCK